MVLIRAPRESSRRLQDALLAIFDAHENRHGQKYRSGEERQRKEHAVIGADRESDAVGHDQPHEPDHARGRHTGGGQERREDVRDALDALHVGPEMTGGLLADRQEVERTRKPHQHDRSRETVQGDHPYGGPVGAREAPHHPEERATHRSRVRDRQHEGHTSREKGSDDHAREEQDAHVHPMVSGRRDLQYEKNREQCSREGRRGERPGE